MNIVRDRALLLSISWLCLWLSASALLGLLGGSISFDISAMLQLPEWKAPFGYDSYGRNLLFITLLSSFKSTAFGIFITLLSCLLAVLIGSSVAMGPKHFHVVLSRILDAFLAFPPLLFALGWGTLIFALLIGSAPGLIRLTFARSQEILAQDFILASRSLGASFARIAFHHVIPAAINLCIVKAPSLFAHALIAEATLSFLGIGAPLGQETWGSLLLQGRDYLVEAPHIAAATGLPLVLMILALQLISERLTLHQLRAKKQP